MRLDPARLPRPAICVFCASSELIGDRYQALAAELGEAMGARKIDLVNGGGSVSMMGSVARAVRASGGHTIGVIPRSLLAWEVQDQDADELVVTENMRDRKSQMDFRSDAFVSLPGGLGTLEELFEAWVGRTLGMHRKPVVVLDPWGDLRPVRDLVTGLVRSGFARQAAADDVVWATSVPEVLDVIERAWQAGEGRRALAHHAPTGRPQEWLEAN